jgi:hypothetical protein
MTFAPSTSVRIGRSGRSVSGAGARLGGHLAGDPDLDRALGGSSFGPLG